MRSIIQYALILCTAILPTGLFAQNDLEDKTSPSPQTEFLEKLQVHWGGFMEFLPMKTTNTGQEIFQNPPLMYGFNIGANYVYIHSNDSYSLSLNPNIHFQFSYDSFLGLGLLAQFPVFVTGRVGAHCTNFNENQFGVGLGMGFNATYIHLPFSDSRGATGQVSQFFIAPAAMAEFTVAVYEQPVTFRFHMNLVPIEGGIEDPSIGNQEIPVDFSNFGIGFLYYFY